MFSLNEKKIVRGVVIVNVKAGGQVAEICCSLN